MKTHARIIFLILFLAPVVWGETVPAGAVMPFTTATCPSGWTAYAAAKGRVVFGVGSGNLDAGGAVLTARTLGQTGGREYTTGIPATTGLGTAFVPSTTLYFGGSGGDDIYATGPVDGYMNGAKADSNMPPHVVVLYCEKQ